MKKLLVFALLIMSGAAFAQTAITKEDAEIIQSVYGKSKHDLVSTYMNLKDAEATAFWDVYEAYEAKRKELGKTRIALLNEYIANIDKMTDLKADELAKGIFKNNADLEKLYSDFYGKMKKAVGAINAAKFIQLEIALMTAIKIETQNSIPFIGEMDNK